MPHAVTQPLTILHDSLSVAGMAHLTEFTQRERVVRALKGWLGLTLAAAVTVFVPILHFVLVPSLVIGGIVVGVQRMRTTRMYTRADGTCPRCQKAVELSLDTAQRFPKWTYCPHCRASLKLIMR